MKVKIILLFTYILFIISCGKSGTYIGNWVDPDDRSFKISLNEDSTITGSYDSRKFTGSYKIASMEDYFTLLMQEQGTDINEEQKKQAKEKLDQQFGSNTSFINVDFDDGSNSLLIYFQKNNTIRFGERFMVRK